MWRACAGSLIPALGARCPVKSKMHDPQANFERRSHRPERLPRAAIPLIRDLVPSLLYRRVRSSGRAKVGRRLVWGLCRHRGHLSLAKRAEVAPSSRSARSKRCISAKIIQSSYHSVFCISATSCRGRGNPPMCSCANRAGDNIDAIKDYIRPDYLLARAL